MYANRFYLKKEIHLHEEISSWPDKWVYLFPLL